MREVLITGGAGFIGSNLAEELIRRGWDVTLLDIKKHPKNIQNFIDKVEYIRMDVRNPNLEKLIKETRPDGIIHLAAISRVVWCEERPEDCISINVGGTENILNAAAKLKEKPWIVFSSSREVYGNKSKLPVKESYARDPASIYASAKCEGEDLIHRFSQQYDVRTIILRLSNVYGNERDIPNRVIPKFIINVLQNEKIKIYGREKLFDFTFINDAVSGIIKSAEYVKKQKEGFWEVYNICTGKPTKLVDLAYMISDIIGVEVNITYADPKPYEVMRFYGDYTKAHNHFGFEPQWDINNGLKYTINRYRKSMEVIQ